MVVKLLPDQDNIEVDLTDKSPLMLLLGATANRHEMAVKLNISHSHLKGG